MEDLETEVHKLAPEDGDIILVRTPHVLRMEQRKSLGDAIRQVIERVGKNLTFLVLDDGISIEVLKTSQLPDLKVAA